MASIGIISRMRKMPITIWCEPTPEMPKLFRTLAQPDRNLGQTAGRLRGLWNKADIL